MFDGFLLDLGELKILFMKFDYKVEVLSPSGPFGIKNNDYEKILNEYGLEGYELVRILTIKNEI